MNGHDRAARLARVAYLGALRRLDDAMAGFERAAVPLDLTADGDAPIWTPEQAGVMTECAEAWAAVVKQHHAFEVAAREARHPEIWRHA